MMTRIKIYPLILGALSLFFFMALPPAFADNTSEQQPADNADTENTSYDCFYKSLFQKLGQGFELNFKATALGEINGIATSSQNPENKFTIPVETKKCSYNPISIKTGRVVLRDQGLINSV